ncbi:MAG: DinB family protein [Chloroflexota bacterium]
MASIKPSAGEIFNHYSTAINKCRKELIAQPWFGGDWWVNVAFGNRGFLFQLSKTSWHNHNGKGIHFEFWLDAHEHESKLLPIVLHFEADVPARKAVGRRWKTAVSHLKANFPDYQINHNAICDKMQKEVKFSKSGLHKIVVQEFSRLQELGSTIDAVLQNEEPQAAYTAWVAQGGNAYVRNLAGAEIAIERGQFNVAKVLRAAAHTQRTLGMQAARQLTRDISAEETLQAIADELIQAPNAVGLNEAAKKSLADIVSRSLASLAANPDILEKDVPIILTGCYNCGILVEKGGIEVCPHCGALAVELEWFGPFYAETAEHLGQLTPDEIIATLESIPKQVENAIAGISNDKLNEKPSADEWCAKEIIAHMFETDLAFAERVRTILSTDGVPALPRAKPPWKLHEGKGYETYSAKQLLTQLHTIRAESLALVRDLSQKDWVRQGTLMGSVSSILDLGTWVANHDKGHLAQIQRLLT